MPAFFAPRRLLQIAVALGSLVPMSAGLAGVIYGPSMAEPSASFGLATDSHFRYLSGLLLAIGLGFATTIPAIEKKTERFQVLSAIVVIGGFGRMVSLLTVGVPDDAMLFGLGMELLVVPILAVSQYLLARSQ